jgi:putative ABC transport system permease protein
MLRMLELKGIKKDYLSGENTVHALKGVDLKFRKSEFVSILGPSGCGKTTMLNIIGGLDGYTDGDLVINGKSTKSFKDRDWDTYRNHSIGFVFQSYNLIPHQTVLQNVELALTLSGVSKSERHERAKKALEDVGLGNQLNKKPSEMSGGQMQRVAIARALVNNPDIILADEPTGALDTVTSVQVMEILKEISKDKLIVMVTHNPELAEQYSSRIIRILDGEITDDTNPMTATEYATEQQSLEIVAGSVPKKIKKPSMSFITAFSLSLKNLLTKKGRTILTSFAGSIGIIGIALILALSNGFTTYIDEVQENALSSYPLSIESKVMDLSSLMETMLGQGTQNGSHDKDKVYSQPIFYDLVNAMSSSNQSENDLKAFKKYIDEQRADENSELGKAISGVQYTYNFDMQVYTENVDGNIILSDPNKLSQEIMQKAMGVDISAMTSARDDYLSSSGLSSMFSTSVVLWEEMLPSENGDPVSDLLKEQYDVVYGSWPENYNEVVLVVDKNNELNDLSLYALGLESEEDMNALADAAMNHDEAESKVNSWTYEEICSRTYRTVMSSSCYTYDESTGTYTDLRESDTGLKYLYDNGIDLKVTGIIRPNEDADSTMLTGSIGYTQGLTDYIIENSKDADSVKAQLADPDTDIFTGLPFQTDDVELTDTQKAEKLKAYIDGLDDTGKAEAYVKIMSIPTDEEITATIAQTTGSMTREEMETAIVQAMSEQMSMDTETLTEYISSMSDDEFDEMFTQAMTEQIKAQKAQTVSEQLSTMSTKELSQALDKAVSEFTDEQAAAYYDETVPQEYSDSTYEDNLETLGYVDLDTPSTINLYASTFEDKEVITDAISDYNDSVAEEQQITYTDYIGIMMSSMKTIINAITYALIAFVAISLIVSSIMIGVITLISVQERTKEIGILRAIGASKRDVSRLFNAETVIIGFTSGLLGVVITYILCIPINVIIHKLTDINNLSTNFPILAAAILTLISVMLTLISGIIPSRSAAKKDPVVALRTE